MECLEPVVLEKQELLADMTGNQASDKEVPVRVVSEFLKGKIVSYSVRYKHAWKCNHNTRAITKLNTSQLNLPSNLSHQANFQTSIFAQSISPLATRYSSL